MSTIRPLATIAVLAALGAFLAFKINEGPPVALNDEWSELAPNGLEAPPAWEGSAEAPSAATLQARSAPSWAEEAGSGSQVAPAVESPPAMPTLPKLPPLQSTEPSGVDPAPLQGVPADAAVVGQPNPAGNSMTPAPQASLPNSGSGQAAPIATPVPPLGGISGVVPSLGRSVSTSAAGEPQFSAQPVGAPGFAAAWEAVQTALARDELPRAHRMLSQWRDEPKLSLEQKGMVDQLLAQLAGTVVYSTEHRLAPPHTVAFGETLPSIAEKYNVPWQLLAKINGIATPDGVQAGQTLKVLRGPFQAELSLQRGEIVVLVDGSYAGKFPVRVVGPSPTEGDWRVGQKRLAGTSASQPTVVLESAAGDQIELSSDPTSTTGTPGGLTIASNDLADLYDILSVGSPVTVRR